jgi:integrase
MTARTYFGSISNRSATRNLRPISGASHGVLGQAVKDGLLLRNPADAATPPTAKEAKAPEMHPWDAGQLAAFLGWAEGASQSFALWHLVAMTGMRRGELLALRWRDVDLEAGTVSVRRSAGMVRVAGESAGVHEGDTKSGKPRVVDLDDEAAAVLRAWRKDRGSMALQLITPGSLVFGDIEGAHRNPEHVSRQFARDIERCGQVPAIRLHDLRHTHATLLLLEREPVQLVSQRLGHASPMVTLTVYAHVMPGNQRETPSRAYVRRRTDWRSARGGGPGVKVLAPRDGAHPECPSGPRHSGADQAEGLAVPPHADRDGRPVCSQFGLGALRTAALDNCIAVIADESDQASRVLRFSRSSICLNPSPAPARCVSECMRWRSTPQISSFVQAGGLRSWQTALPLHPGHGRDAVVLPRAVRRRRGHRLLHRPGGRCHRYLTVEGARFVSAQSAPDHPASETNRG